MTSEAVELAVIWTERLFFRKNWTQRPASRAVLHEDDSDEAISRVQFLLAHSALRLSAVGALSTRYAASNSFLCKNRRNGVR